RGCATPTGVRSPRRGGVGTGQTAHGSVAPALSLQLVEARVGDPEMVGDLVIDRVGHSRRKPFRRPVGPHQWAAEDRDLARDRGALGGPARPRDALVETVEPGCADRLELPRRRLLL